jgi:hypothetical protein
MDDGIEGIDGSFSFLLWMRRYRRWFILGSNIGLISMGFIIGEFFDGIMFDPFSDELTEKRVFYSIVTML